MAGRGRPKKGAVTTKVGRRRGSTYFWRQGAVPLEEAFIQRHSELTDTTYEDAYNTVFKVMVTLQDMLLNHPKFMLPGIGIIGVAENPRRGIIVSSSTFWWTPGFVTLLGAAPGWENAPLNKFLTVENVKTLNKHIAKIKSDKRQILSPNQFYQASDFDLEGVTSDKALEWFEHKEDVKRRDKQEMLQKNRTIYNLTLRKSLIERIRYLESKLPDEEPYDIGDEYDKIQDAIDRKLQVNRQRND